MSHSTCPRCEQALPCPCPRFKVLRPWHSESGSVWAIGDKLNPGDALNLTFRSPEGAAAYCATLNAQDAGDRVHTRP